MIMLSALIISTAGLNIYYHTCSNTGEKMASLKLEPVIHEPAEHDECPMCLEDTDAAQTEYVRSR